MSGNIVLFTGGFDPLHGGHLNVIKESLSYGRVVIGINSDEWLNRKKGRSFMKVSDREYIMKNIKGVMSVIQFDDSDDTAIDAIMKTKKMFPNNKIIFVNGGDRDILNVPEMNYFKGDGSVDFMFNVGGGKTNSSSLLLDEWKSPKTNRPWGYYRVLHEDSGIKIKELTVNPKSSLSNQMHNNRNEFWMIVSGTASIELDGVNHTLNKHESISIPVESWHKLNNFTDSPLKVAEIQYGTLCEESDIIRK